MTSIFLSRPTWVSDEYRTGLDGFLRVLESLDLQPRSVGTTDQPTLAPLDEVINLMTKCAGAVILGYPQISITAGSIKGKPIDREYRLATEWNHMEAGLAHASGLPLLVMHHVGVGRGIFDRGAIGNFIHEVDFSEPSWPLRPEVHGAVRKWKEDCLTPKKTRRRKG
jgi:hypothetical protein